MKIDSIFRYTTIVLLVISLFSVNISAGSQSQPGKTKAEVDAIITQASSVSPEWWDSTELTYPETLDMNWPVQQAFGGRMGGRGGRGGERGGRGGRGFGFGMQQDTQMSVDQYLMQVIYPNASRHKAGIKLVNHLMIMHKDDEEKLRRSLNTLGNMFYELLDDYARAAFWWQKYEKAGGTMDSLKLARCYFELGSKSTAAELLSKADNVRNNKDLIKLWAKIGEVDKALEMIKSNTSTNQANTGRGGRGFGRGGNSQSSNYLLAAEICRVAGRYDEAIEYYEKVITLPDSETQAMERHGTDGKVKANSNLEASKLLKKLELKRVPDGSYTATTTGYGGPMTVQVTVKSGKIESLEITQHRETPSYLVMAEPTARQIVTKQGFEGVDVITGATVTSDAIIHAAAEALVNAME